MSIESWLAATRLFLRDRLSTDPLTRDHHAAAGKVSFAARPIFIGGTGRSGTTIMSALIGRHHDVQRIKTEVKFIASAGGLCDLVRGRTTIDAFERSVLGRWYRRGPTRGLQAIMPEADVEAALPALRVGYRRDPWLAARAFTHAVLDPLAVTGGARSWVEMTPASTLVAGTLFELFPDLRLIHAVRDGRDVACSVVKMPWGPSDQIKALDWWYRRLEQGYRACAALPGDRVLVVQLEDLIDRNREVEYGRLLAFLGLDDDPVMRRFFETEMLPERAHLGRWREEVPAGRRAAFEARYERYAQRLARHGRPYRPIEAPLAVG
jgi:hypothetical protein